MDDQIVRSTVIDDDQNLDNKSKYNPLANLGKYSNGGPGRPPGAKNKFTLIKEQIAEVWAEKEGKKKFAKLFDEDFVKALDRTIAILPKETEDKGSTNVNIYNVVNFNGTKPNH